MVSVKSLLLFLLMSCFICHSCFAQTGATYPKAVSGVIQTSEGTPVVDAKVHLVGGAWDEPKVFTTTTSNSDGKFEFTSEQFNEIDSAFSALAQHAEHGFGWSERIYPDVPRNLTVKLGAVATLDGQLMDASERPVPDATIYPELFFKGTLSSQQSDYAQVPKGFSASWQTKTDKDGRFSMSGIPAGGAGAFKVEHPTIESLSVQFNFGKPVRIKLDAAVACSGKIKLPDNFDRTSLDGKSIGKVNLACYLGRNKNGEVVQDQNSVVMRYVSKFSAPIDDDLNFHFDGVYPGAYRVNIAFSDSILLAAPSKIPLWSVTTEVEPLVVETVPLFRVSGKVVSSTTGEAVAGAKVDVNRIVNSSLRYVAQPITDDQGVYSVNVPPGKLYGSVSETPSGFVPSPEHVGSDVAEPPTIKLDITADTTLPDIKVDPACDVVIKVTDQDGKPAAGAIVKVVTLAGYPDGDFRKPVQKTDANGMYTIKQVAVNDTLPIWVRTPTTVSEPLIITPGDLDGPVAISLSTEGVRFRVRVINDDDEPAAGVKVSLGTTFRYQSKWSDSTAISGSAGSGITDENGQFVSGPLWPGSQYELITSAEGFSKAETPRLAGRFGEIVDAGELVITRARVQSVKGTVVDSAGVPVAGATVFCAGKSYAQAVTTTDTDGRFTLNEVSPDLKYVFAQHQDFRFGGGVVFDSQPIEIKLRSKKDPPRGIRKLKSVDVEQRHSSAKALLLRALELPIGARNTSRINLLVALDRLDQQLASERSAIDGGVANRSIQAARAKRLDIRDAEKVTLLLRTLRQRTAFIFACRYCRRMSRSNDDSDHAIADAYLKFASEFVGDKINDKISLAGLYSQRVKLEESQTLIDDIFKTLEDNKIADDRNHVQGLAVALAPIDFDKAIKLTEKLKEGYPQTFAQADVALAVLQQNQEKSLATIEQLKGDSNAINIRDKTRFRAALRLIDTNPDLAIELVYKCEDKGNRSQALARLAVRVAEFDRPKSWKMIEDAIGNYTLGLQFSPWSNYGGHGPFAAAIAYQAKLVEYPDMESVIWHVLAACRSGSDKGQERMMTTISTARMLALTDKFAARKLLGLVADDQDQIPRERHSLSLYDQYLQAWTLVDFDRGTSLIKKDLERVEKLGAANHFRYGHGGVFNLLVAPPEERFHLMFQQTGLWQLDEDDTELNW